MGKSLAETYPQANEIFERANRTLDFDLAKLCFEGPDEQLKLTENTQPAILTASIAAWTVLKDRFSPEYVAGHSLGEYSALVAAGALEFEDAIQLVRKRGGFMQEAVPAGVGAMAALLKMPESALDGVLAEAAQGEVVTAANLNSPDQMVISGSKGAVERAIALAKQAGCKRAVLLPVSAPFHSPLMAPAQERMKVELDHATFRDLQVPLINNVDARQVRSGSEAREGLVRQVSSPVRWTETVRLLAKLGVTQAIEVGPGGVLSGLIRTIEPSIATAKFGEAEDLENLPAA